MIIPNMSLLISCCNAEYTEGLYQLDFVNQEPNFTKVFEGDCRGIAKYQDKFLVASATRNKLFLLDEKFNVAQEKPAAEYMDYHGVFVDQDSAFVVEANRNAISIYDLPTLQFQREIRFSQDPDACHLNDVDKVGDQLFVSMFALEMGHWRNLPQNSGVIVEYSLEKNMVEQVHFPHLDRPHSVKCYDNSLWYCNSGQFEVRKDTDVIFQGTDWTRGLTFYENLLFFGQSSRGKEMNSRIYIVDRSDSSHQFVPIPSQEIYEIIVL